MDNKYATRKNFQPEKYKVYINDNGREYTCLDAWEGAAVMESAEGWVCITHGCGIYADGTIDWAYSTGGHFSDNARRC